jgi:hypothetical protein
MLREANLLRSASAAKFDSNLGAFAEHPVDGVKPVMEWTKWRCIQQVETITYNIDWSAQINFFVVDVEKPP